MWLFPETEAWVYDLSTTDECIQASVGPKDFRFPKLPKRADGHRPDPVELWIRTGDTKARAEVLKVWNTAQRLLRATVPDDAHRGRIEQLVHEMDVKGGASLLGHALRRARPVRALWPAPHVLGVGLSGGALLPDLPAVAGGFSHALHLCARGGQGVDIGGDAGAVVGQRRSTPAFWERFVGRHSTIGRCHSPPLPRKAGETGSSDRQNSGCLG